jgi:HEPN domain-containing protein
MRDELLKIADKDLQTAILLFDNHYYAPALFYLQQSAEKSNKAFGLFLGITTEEELHSKIRHEPTKIYEKMFVNLKNNYKLLHEKLLQSPKVIKPGAIRKFGFKQGIRHSERLVKRLENFRKNKLKMVFLSSGEIKSIFGEIEVEYNEILSRRFDEIEFRKYIASIVEFLEALRYLNPSKIDEEKTKLMTADLKEFKEKYFHKLQKAFARYMRIYFVLFYLGIITMPHSVLTRYPDYSEKATPVRIYNKQLPIIRHLPLLMRYQKDALSNFKKIIKESKKASTKR